MTNIRTVRTTDWGIWVEGTHHKFDGITWLIKNLMASIEIATLATHVYTPKHEHPAPIFVTLMTRNIRQTDFILTTHRTARFYKSSRRNLGKIMFERSKKSCMNANVWKKFTAL